MKRIEKRHPNIKYKGVLPSDKIVEKQLETSFLVNPRPSGEEFCVYSFPSKTKASNVCSRSELTKCTIGRYTYIGYQNFMVNVSIGSFCSIADRCSIGGAIHPMEYVSTSPVFHEGGNILRKNFSKHPMQKTPRTVIEHDVWIGQGVFIKAGVTISTGAVIGMGSVVTNDVGSYEIWAGYPARLIRKRFDEEIIKGLLDSKWWELGDDKLSTYANYFNSPENFLREIEKHS